MRDHTKLEVFQLADQLALLVYSATNSFPAEEKFRLTSQLRRAAVSVAANIVEACALFSKADYIRQLSIAYGSAKELQYEISLAMRLGYIPPKLAEALTMQSSRTARALWSLTRTLRDSSSDRRP